MKRKFFTTLAIFASLALAACGGNGGQNDGPKWESDKTNHWHINADGEKVDKASHEFEEDTAQAVAATCSAEGKKVEICKVCGYVKETSIKKLNHTFVEDTAKSVAPTCSAEGKKVEKCSVCGFEQETKLAKTEHTWSDWANDEGAKCGQPGTRSRECSICHQKETETLGIIPHDWDLEHATTVAAADGGVEYTIAKCKKCNADGYFVAAAKATLGAANTGTPKTAPDGCIKLGKDNDTMSVSFKVSGAKTGVFWLRGTMDYWYEDSNNNQNKTYYSQNNGHTSEANKQGNFKVEVGPAAGTLAEVELPDDTSLTFAQMLPETVGFDTGGHQWSVIGDCIVGAFSLVDGLNTVKFTRVDSYNLAVHDFLFVVPAAA